PPPALAAAANALVAAATAREVGSRCTTAATTAAAAIATLAVLVATGHLFSTTTFDLFGTAVLVLLLLRALRLGGPVPWLLLGAATGVALHVKLLPAVVLACCGLALLLCGPRRPLRPPWPWAAAALAVLLAAPHLTWQAAAGWPQLEMSRAIAAGSSGTSVERWEVLPLQVLMVGPLLFPVFVAGLVVLWRSPQRWLAVAYLLLLAETALTGGKPYYAMGPAPAVLAAAAAPLLRWAARGPGRRPLAVLAVAGNLVGAGLSTLPWLPVRDAGPLLAVNYDLGEQVGWPELVRTVGEVTAGLPAASTAVITANYGEAGALARARRQGADLPPVFSGHNGFAGWGPPPATTTTVVLVGLERPDVFGGCRLAARLGNAAGLDNDEAGAPVSVCRYDGDRGADWPRLRHLG
ncbi:glycosyltransferase family 39 protein, partial [Kineococcus glutinatus]|uniref:glycosyltransferase family 39 protein n=1 Tax=Kineococcus glutinatus TaxID=1070872 RepID=UPI0031ECE08A